MSGSKQRPAKPVAPPPLSRVFTEQGDERLVRDPRTGRNRYGCLSFPGEARPCFGSATASSVSAAAFAAVQELHAKVGMAPASSQAAECDRVRSELAGFCGVDGVPGAEIVFAASGTDLHLIVAQLCGSVPAEPSAPPLAVVLSETSETGHGVPAALAGRFYNARAPFQAAVPVGGALEGCRPVETHAVAGRSADGSARPAKDVDDEMTRLVERALGAGQDALLIVSDQSKTGLLMPSPSRALDLKRRFGSRLEIFVDACQMRLTPETLRAYVEHGFLVGVTGSKFATGPAFSGALIVPAGPAGAWKARRLPDALSDYSARADWPKGWSARETLREPVNLGLLFRWQAALAEIHPFHRLPRPAVAAFFRAFGAAVRDRLERDAAFEPLDAPALDRSGIAPGGGWDTEPTLFPFQLARRGKTLDYDACRAVYLAVLERHGEIGQPACCGTRDGAPLGALRLCASMRLAVEALKTGGRGADAVIADAMGFLGRISSLVAEPQPAAGAR